METRPFDAVDYLDSEEGIRAFLADALRDSPEAFTHAQGVAARARTMIRVRQSRAAPLSGSGRGRL